MFIGPCIIVIVEEWKNNLLSLAILFHFLCAQHASDINISIIRSLRLCCWITTSVVLFCKDVPSWSCSQAVSKPVWHIRLSCVQWKTPDGGQRNCSKHVEFYSKNKFEKLVHLVGFTYHDARSPERQIIKNLIQASQYQHAGQFGLWNSRYFHWQPKVAS